MVAVNEKSCILAISFICRVKSVELIMASRKQSGSFYICFFFITSLCFSYYSSTLKEFASKFLLSSDFMPIPTPVKLEGFFSLPMPTYGA